jgi:tubulin alpha
LFHANQFVSGTQGAANVYSRGFYSVGKELIETTMNQIRCLAEECNSFQGFFLFLSLNGGTGSGFSSLLLTRFSEYAKKHRITLSVFPWPHISNVVTEPYNNVLGMNQFIESVAHTVAVDNEAIYDICRSSLDIERPTSTHVNRLMARVASSIPASVRFESPLRVDLSSLLMNLTPYKWLHWYICSSAPVVGSG